MRDKRVSELELQHVCIFNLLLAMSENEHHFAIARWEYCKYTQLSVANDSTYVHTLAHTTSYSGTKLELVLETLCIV